MPKALGLMNPDNAAKSAGPFKEGLVRIDSNSYKVHQGKPGEGEPPVPATKWSWNVTRLAEDGEEPLTDEHGEAITEELLFSFGGKCLPFVHPGRADSVDDEDVEDLGTGLTPDGELGGNTIYLNAPDWKPNERSGLMVLTKSLVKQGIKAEYLNRCWTPDWNGCVFEVKNQEGEKGRDGRAFNYKIVTKMLVGPGSKKAGAKSSGKANGKALDAEGVLASILSAMSTEMDGQQVTRKTFVNRVKSAMDAAKVDNTLLVPVLTLCKDDQWLKAHEDTFDFVLYPEDNTIIFGKAAGA